MRQALALVTTFAVVLALVLGGAALAPRVTGETQQSLPDIENPQYTDEEVLPDDSPGQANVTMSADVEPQTIVIDPGIESGPEQPRGLRFLLGLVGPETTERDMLPLVNTLVENGHEVQIYSLPDERDRRAGPSPPGTEQDGLSSLGEELADADAFVTFRTDYSDDQLSDIATFADEDGRVVVASEPDDTFEEPGGSGLKSAVGVTTQPGYVYNLEENDLNYQRIFAESGDTSPVTAGVDRAVFPTASPVGVANSADAALVPTDGAELSTTRADTEAPVLLHRDDVVVVGDTDFLIPENAQRADTDVLIGNLADFLVTNDRNPEKQAPQQDIGPTDQQPTRPTPPGGAPGNATGPTSADTTAVVSG